MAGREANKTRFNLSVCFVCIAHHSSSLCSFPAQQSPPLLSQEQSAVLRLRLVSCRPVLFPASTLYRVCHQGLGAVCVWCLLEDEDLEKDEK